MYVANKLSKVIKKSIRDLSSTLQEWMLAGNTYLPATKMPKLTIEDPLFKHPSKQLFAELLTHQKASTKRSQQVTSTIPSYRERPISVSWKETASATVIHTAIQEGRVVFTLEDELYDHLKRPLSRDSINPIVVHAWIEKEKRLDDLCFNKLFDECGKYLQLLFVVVQKEQAQMFKKHFDQLCQTYNMHNVFIIKLPGNSDLVIANIR